MAMSRKDFVQAAITQRNTEHLFLDRVAFVQHTCVTANTYRGLNARFNFDFFMSEVGIRADEWKEMGGMSGHYIQPTAPVRVPKAPRRRAVA